MRETGLEKGGIYNHFGSKEEIALEAFDYAASLMCERFEAALTGRTGALDRLFAITEVLGGGSTSYPSVTAPPIQPPR